ncbi:P-loop containing nucleoside triphosphate hydrolase protein [Rhizophagus clarus]|uniref:P-loop containing nucleoside triphosphate hydrolase protein n=1 Tax=Rhizophagus clarus TaxID=94130 RepID=A0A8H3QFA3_9GLOM|nr:P-loop containing nucleoside triphosphate hydrolase protein [Rhizophagus clarus]
MTEIRNILLIGKSGSGKSTLANVLVNKNGNLEEVFIEGYTGESETKEVKVGQFESDGIIYRIIDTVGIGDTNLSKEEALNKMKGIFDILKDNFSLNQILFTLRDKFTNEQIKCYDLLKEVIFDNNMENFTTIVRTGFAKFRKPEEREKDKKALKNVIKNWKDIIYINNLSKDEEQELKSRKESRVILLEYLKTCQEVYQPELLGKFHKIIKDFDSIYDDTNQEIERYIKNLKNVQKWIKDFISKRKTAMKELGQRKEDRSDSEQTRLVANDVLNGMTIVGGAALLTPAAPIGLIAALVGASALGSTISDGYAGIKESGDNKLLMKHLKGDEELVKVINNLWPELICYRKKFSDIRSKYSNLEYKKLKLNEKTIEAFDEILAKTLESELEAFQDNAKKEINYSGGLAKVGRAILKFSFRGPIPSIYYLGRDIRRQASNKEPLSLSDIEKTIKELIKDLESWEEREKSLLKEIENFEAYQKKLKLVKMK